MPIKLFTIGDSISQGFMSGAAAKTGLSFSSLLAQSFGLTLDSDQYRVPTWEKGGLPINIERLARLIMKKHGPNIRAIELPAIMLTVRDYMDDVEDYYEREAGSDLTTNDETSGEVIEYFHNIAIQGFTVADAWQVTPELCLEYLRSHPAKDHRIDQIPEGFFYRIAYNVLNPSRNPAHNDLSQLGWLNKHVQEQGVENLILWLGANNALGTIVKLRINQTADDPNRRPHKLPHHEREAAGWNLWHPGDFTAEYEELITRVTEIMLRNGDPNWRVFLATVPLVTIAPLAKGVGSTTYLPNKGFYYKYYTYFLFEEAFARETGLHLTLQDALHIDDCIRAYNEFIIDEANRLNSELGRRHFFVIDIEHALNQLAYKRNQGYVEEYDWPPFLDYHYPRVNTKFYHADSDAQLKQGGIVSLDGIHPSAIGHGLIAHEFIKVMRQDAGIEDIDPVLNWHAIMDSDTLYTDPIPLMPEIYRHKPLIDFILNQFLLHRSR